MRVWVLAKNLPHAMAGIGRRAAPCRGRLVCRLGGLAGTREVKSKAGRGLLRGMQGCSEQQDQGLSSSWGLCKHDISPQIYGLLPATAGRLQQSSLLSSEPAGRGSPFPGRKFLAKAAKRRSLSSPARTPRPPERCLYALLSKSESSWLSIPHAPQGELSREKLRGCWMHSALGGRRSGGRALQPPTSSPPHSPALEHHLGALPLPFGRWFRITFRRLPSLAVTRGGVVTISWRFSSQA